MRKITAPKPQKTARLKFFDTFVKAMGFTYRDLSMSMGYTPPTAACWFRTDNVKLSQIRKFLEVLPSYPGHEADRYELHISYKLRKDEKLVDYSEFIRDGKPVKLMFVWDAIRRSGLSKQGIARRMGSAYEKLKYWKETDDICTDDMYALAVALEAQLVFEFVPESNDADSDVPGVEYSIVLRNRQTIVSE